MTLSNGACARRFAEGRPGKAAHMRSYGDEVYSYGTCIARRLRPGLYLVNVERYSSTTSSHQLAVASVMEEDARFIELDDGGLGVDLRETDLLHRSFDAFTAARRLALKSAVRARSPHRRACWRADAAVAAERLRRIRLAQRAFARRICPGSRTLAAIMNEPGHAHGLACLAHARLPGVRGRAEAAVAAHARQRAFDVAEPPDPPAPLVAPIAEPKPYTPPPSQANLSAFPR